MGRRDLSRSVHDSNNDDSVIRPISPLAKVVKPTNRLHTGARVNAALLTYLLTYLLTNAFGECI